MWVHGISTARRTRRKRKAKKKNADSRLKIYPTRCCIYTISMQSSLCPCPLFFEHELFFCFCFWVVRFKFFVDGGPYTTRGCLWSSRARAVSSRWPQKTRRTQSIYCRRDLPQSYRSRLVPLFVFGGWRQGTLNGDLWDEREEYTLLTASGSTIARQIARSRGMDVLVTHDSSSFHHGTLAGAVG